MKSLKPLIFGIVICIVSFVSCKKRFDNGNNFTNEKSIEKKLVSGNWKITKVMDKNAKDLTKSFPSFSFTFSKGGAFTYNANGTATDGTWSFSSEKQHIEIEGIDTKSLSFRVTELRKEELKLKEFVNDQYDFIEYTFSH